MVGTARKERAFAHPTRSRSSILLNNSRRVGKAKRAHHLNYDTSTPSIATMRKLGFSVSSSCDFNS
ncbi:hypothetical protein ABIA43_001599 [Bradyrhizobium sp. USDA 328]